MSTTKESLGVVGAITYSFSLGIGPDTEHGTLLDVQWGGLPNRNPSASGDFVALWQNSGQIPFGMKAQAIQNVTNTTPDGDLVFTGLSLARLPYVVAYSVGSDASTYHNVAAAIPIGVGGTAGPAQVTTLNTAFVGSTSLILNYTTPTNVTPASFGHTVALYQSSGFDPADPPSDFIATKSPSDDSSGAVGFNGITLVSGSTYTAAYLTDGTLGTNQQPKNLTTVAATVTFTVPMS